MLLFLLLQLTNYKVCSFPRCSTCCHLSKGVLKLENFRADFCHTNTYESFRNFVNFFKLDIKFVDAQKKLFETTLIFIFFFKNCLGIFVF